MTDKRVSARTVSKHSAAASKLYGEGLSTFEIGRKLKISQGMVARILDSCGVKRRSRSAASRNYWDRNKAAKLVPYARELRMTA